MALLSAVSDKAKPVAGDVVTITVTTNASVATVSDPTPGANPASLTVIFNSTPETVTDNRGRAYTKISDDGTTRRYTVTYT